MDNLRNVLQVHRPFFIGFSLQEFDRVALASHLRRINKQVLDNGDTPIVLIDGRQQYSMLLYSMCKPMQINTIIVSDFPEATKKTVYNTLDLLVCYGEPFLIKAPFNVINMPKQPNLKAHRKLITDSIPYQRFNYFAERLQTWMPNPNPGMLMVELDIRPQGYEDLRTQI